MFANLHVSPIAKAPKSSATDTGTESHLKMKHLAAYLLLGLAGNTSPSESDIKTVLESVGIDADDDRLSKLIEELKGKDMNEVRTLGH